MAVIANHNGASLANVYSNARNSYNGVCAYPTTKFDGVLSHVGGGSTSLYSLFLSKVEQRNAVMSDFTINLSFEHLSGNDYHATAVVENVGGYTGSNIVLQLVVTESDLNINWGIGDDVNSVNRLMIPNQNGTALDFSGGDIQTIERDFTMQGYWVKDNCELIAFVQDNSSKEILQATLVSMEAAEYNLDAALVSLSGVPEMLCQDVLSPTVEIKNNGVEVLTSLDITFEINGEVIYTYPWEGSLEFPQTETIEIPEFTFDPQDENEIVASVTDPNNGSDQNPDNDNITAMTEATAHCTDYVALILKTDDFPQQTTYEVLGPNGNVIGSGGPYTQPNTFVKDTVFLTQTGCHRFILYDSGGNGLSTFYTLRSVVDGVATSINSGGSFGYEEETQFTSETETMQASFSSNVSSGCNDLTVDFTDMSVGGITEWNWTFEGGDPATSTDQNPTVYFGTPGTYDVSLTVSDGANSNTYDATGYITVWELPDVQISAIGDQCIDWPGFELTQGTPAGGTYSGPGVQDGWFYPDMAGSGTHTITYSYTDGNGCENMAQQDILVDECTGLGDIDHDRMLRIYPNPVTSQATIAFYAPGNTNVTVSIYNSIGMLVKEIAGPSTAEGTQEVNISTDGFDNGIYFVKLSAGENTFTRKMTIVR